MSRFESLSLLAGACRHLTAGSQCKTPICCLAELAQHLLTALTIHTKLEDGFFQGLHIQNRLSKPTYTRMTIAEQLGQCRLAALDANYSTS